MAELRARDVVVGQLIGPNERAFVKLAARNIVDLEVLLALIGQRNDIRSALDLAADIGVSRQSKSVFCAEHRKEFLDRALCHQITAARNDDLCADDADDVIVDRQALARRDALGAVGRTDEDLGHFREAFKSLIRHQKVG